MATAALEPTHAYLSAWSEQTQRFEAELEESFAALDAYQRQLDTCQRRLAAEREQLEHERVRLREQADAAMAAVEQNDQTGQLEAELNATRQRAAELEARLAAGQSEAHALQEENARLAAESQQATRERQEIESQLAEARAELARQKQHWSNEFSRVVKMLEEQQSASAAVAASAQPEPLAPSVGSGSDPVLGSVVAQFSKLRQQRAERGLR